MNIKQPAPLRCDCAAQHFEQAYTYDGPPEGETRFSFSTDGSYAREIAQCRLCRHYVSVTEMDMSELYGHDYVSGTYGDAEGVRRTFDRINALAPERSDNVGRVRRLVAFAEDYLTAPAEEGRPPTVLDVGSGLGVFPYRIKQAGWDCTALDTDERLVSHVREAIDIPAVCGYFGEVGDLGRFDVVTFNKVLEHVEDPVALLAKSAQYLNPGGFVYVELPDGEGAAQEGAEREEFFIEHLHVFSMASIALLAARAGFDPVAIERLQEPSTKYTLRAFLRLSATVR